MSKNRWFKFFPSDFLTGVRNLSPIEITAYIIVLCELYDNEGLIRRDDEHFSRACLIRKADFSRALDGLIAKGKINVIEGMLTNKRVSEEVQKRATAATDRARLRHGHDMATTSPRHEAAKKNNEIKGRKLDVGPYIEERIKNTSSLDVDALYSPSEPVSGEEASKQALEGFRARQRRRQDRFH
jgi:uncharacterized protein YdaU (DUF1376 family)